MHAAGLREDGHGHVLYSEAEREAIHQQLERMVANPLFKFSRRYPNLLRYVVEHALDGHTEELKERSLGVAVFGREPDYDTNADPIVRATASEIRKRIAQYYHEGGHQSEIRIDLSPRSYVPEFEIPPAVPQVPEPTSVPAAPGKVYTAHRLGSRILFVTAVAGLLAVAALFIPWPVRSNFDAFWKPVLDSSSTVLFCLGQRQFYGSSPELGQTGPSQGELPGELKGPITLFQLYYMGSQNLSLPDVIAVSRLNGLLQAKGRKIQIRGGISTDFADLRDGAVILVGAFDNEWTMRLTGPLRFTFERDRDRFWIRDRQNPTRRDRAVSYNTPYLDVTEDYALISRTLDPTTGRMVVVIGGLTGYGTIAAGEFLTDPAFLDAMAEGAPRGWERKNIQLVLSTKVIHGTSGPPRLLDRHFW